MAESTGTILLRKENVSAIVTGFARQNYKMKPLCMIDTSSAWIESYYKESKAELTGGTGASIKGIPRLAAFPYGEVTWTKVSSYIEKYGLEGVISEEDADKDNIPVLQRTLLRIGRAVTYAVDTQIEAVMAAASGANTLYIAVGSAWNSATVANRDPVQDILNAKKELAVDNYDPDDGNGYLVLNPTDYANILGNSKVVNNPTFKSADVVANGVVGQIVGLKIVVTNACRVSQAYVLKAKEALTWKEAKALTVETIHDPGIKYTIRAYELGVAQAPNVEAICIIQNTNSTV